MAGIEWTEGEPPTIEGRRVLVIASPRGGTYDAAADNRPDIFIGHWHDNGWYVPARIGGMSENEARPRLDPIKCWAEINLPSGVELRELTARDCKG